MVVYLLMMAAIGPVILAWMFADTLDWTPWIVLLVVGLGISVGVWRTKERVSDRLQHVLMALPLWFLSAGLFANAFLDGSEPERHASEVLRLTNPSKGPGEVVMTDFRPGGGELSLHRNSPLAGRLAKGDKVTLVVRKGLFGWVRLQAIEPRS